MIDIDIYRSRIGRFYQMPRKKKLKIMTSDSLQPESKKSERLVIITLHFVLKSALLLALLSLNYSSPQIKQLSHGSSNLLLNSRSLDIQFCFPNPGHLMGLLGSWCM